MCLQSYTILCFHIFSPFSWAPQFKENLRFMKIKSKNMKCPFKKKKSKTLDKKIIFTTTILYNRL